MKGSKNFYESEIKGKDTDKLSALMKRLYASMERRKRETEAFLEIRENREPRAEIAMIRENIEMAKRAIIEAGGEYTPNVVEKRDEEFRAKVPSISKIELSIVRYLGGEERKTFRVKGNDAVIETRGFTARGEREELIKKVDKEAFLDAVSELHIGEWRRKYDPIEFGIVVLDGVYWNLGVYYSNGHKAKKFRGNNVFPYNFDALIKLFDMEMTD